MENGTRNKEKRRKNKGLGLLWWVLIAISALLVVFELARGQEIADDPHGAIKGNVLDAATHQPIALANVLVPGTTVGAATDLEGVFLIRNLPPGTYSLQVSAVGYMKETLYELLVTPGRTRTVDVVLKPTVVKGEEVTVTAERYVPSTPDLPTSARNFRYEEVRRAPGGLEDVQRTVQALPGVVNSNDQDNAIIVRGGAPNENLTIIDGIEIENTNHLTIGNDVQGNGGPINALDTEFLQDVTFASGGFSARYGDRLSSVLVLDLREGSRERYAGAADINMAGAGGYVEGPFPGKRGSFLVSAHRAYLSLLPPEDFGVASWPEYWNGQAKLVYDLGDKNKLTVNGLTLEDIADDLAKPSDDTDGQWTGLKLQTRRTMSGARLRTMWGGGFSDVVVARSQAFSEWHYTDNVEQADGSVNTMTTAHTRRVTTQDQLHINWHGRGFGKDQFEAGVSIKPLRYEYDFYVRGDSILYDDGALGNGFDGEPDLFRYPDQREVVDQHGIKTGSYLQYTMHLRDALTFTGGIRYDGFDYAHQHALAPRASLSWGFKPRWSLNLAWGIYYQSHDPSVTMNSADREYNRNLPYSQAIQYVTGLTFQPRTSSLVSVEGFYKDYSHLLVREEDVVRQQTGDQRFTSDRWLAEGTKQAWGIEFFAQQKLATNWYGTLSYSYGMADEIDSAFGTYASDYDYRHVVTASVGYKTNLIVNRAYHNFLTKPWGWWLWVLPLNGDEVTFSSRYRLMSGRPYTHEVWYGDGVASPEPIYEGHWEEQGHNNERYPGYSRWDVRVDSKYFYGHSALIFYVELQNIDDHLNVADYVYKENGVKETALQFRQFYVLGLRYEF